MKKLLLLKSLFLLCALIVGTSAWAAEGDTHDFPQSINALLNNQAAIDDINIAAQSYPVKEVIISYTHNKSLIGDFVTASCSVGGDSWGDKMLTCYTTTTQSFTGSSATGAIVISFTNPRTGTKQGTLQITNVRLVEGAASTKVAQPSFSPAAGAVEAGTTVTISSATDDATIYYTMGDNPADPTTSSTQYTGPITINEATTIKAIAVKAEMDDSNVASASYTIKEVVHGYAIDFEKPIAVYEDWTITNIGIHTSGLTKAHSGSAWGSNVNNDGNGTSTAIIQTKEKVAYPGTFTCYISKESTNTTSSSWKIQTSSDGSSWTDIATLSSMTQNTWTKFTGDIKKAGKTNVYVRLYYSGSTAKRAVDDIELTTYVPVTIGTYQWATFVSDKALDFTDSDVKAYVVTGASGSAITKTAVTTVAANTPLLLNAPAETYTIPAAATGTNYSTTNKLVAGTGAAVAYDANSGYNYVLSIDNGKAMFMRIVGTPATVPSGKAYLALDAAPSGARGLNLFDDEDVTGVADVRCKMADGRNDFYNLNGQKVLNPTKGLYIVNGKKYVIK
jgi:hypothetical protein